MKYKIQIGIDPDVDKSGVAVKNKDGIVLMNLRFFDLFEYLKTTKILYGDMIVVIEGGWLNKSNWHKKQNGSAALNAKIGSHTGANHEAGRKIVEMCEYLEIKFRVVRPSKSKVNTQFFYKLTGIKRSNQEQRDAYMLIV